MRFSTSTEIKRKSFVESATRYVARDTYSDKVLVNKGKRPVRGDFLTAFEKQLKAASEYVSDKLARVSF